MTEVRAEIVAEILAVMHDEHLSTSEIFGRVLTHPDANAAERMAVARIMADELAVMLPDVIDIRPTVTSLSLRQLQSLACVYGVVAGWDIVITHPDRSLADAMKIIPKSDVDLIDQFLQVGWPSS